MSVERNMAALKKAVGDFSAATLETYLQFYHPDAKLHFLPPDLPQGREGARLFYQYFLSAFPDARVQLEDTVAEGDKIGVRYTLEGTHRGDFLGIAATNRAIAVEGISIFRFENGQCVERWNQSNLSEVMHPRAIGK